MAEFTIRDLRNHGNEIVNRAARGEQILITRSGSPVAELHAVSPAISAAALLSRWKHLPRVEPATLRADIDGMLDPG